MKRQAGLVTEEDEEDDAKSEEEDENLAEAVQNLNVFCCSSTDYLKLCNKLPKDGPPVVSHLRKGCVIVCHSLQVFTDKEDTGVPSLQRFVHKVTELRCLQATERLIRSTGRTVADILSYVADQGTKVIEIQ
jgi:hypothetical protein